MSGGQAEVDAIQPETEETPAPELPLVDEMFEAVTRRPWRREGEGQRARGRGARE
jgi:hypothetical protein